MSQNQRTHHIWLYYVHDDLICVFLVIVTCIIYSSLQRACHQGQGQQAASLSFLTAHSQRLESAQQQLKELKCVSIQYRIFKKILAIFATLLFPFDEMNSQLIYYFLAIHPGLSEPSKDHHPRSSTQHKPSKTDTSALGSLCPLRAQHLCFKFHDPRLLWYPTRTHPTTCNMVLCLTSPPTVTH